MNFQSVHFMGNNNGLLQSMGVPKRVHSNVVPLAVHVPRSAPMVILAPKPRVLHVPAPVAVHPLVNPNLVIVKHGKPYQQIGWGMNGQPVYKRIH